VRPDKIRGNVFVANLPRGLTDERLAELFDPYGMVLRAHLARDPATGETLGHGLVLIAPDRVVEEAVGALNGGTLAGRRIEARRADPEMSITVPTRPRGPGWGARPAVPGGMGRDHRTPRPPASGQRTTQPRQALARYGGHSWP